jgi:hypothetical protein
VKEASLSVSHDCLSVTLTLPAGTRLENRAASGIVGVSLGQLLLLAKERGLADSAALRAGFAEGLSRVERAGEAGLGADEHVVVLRGKPARDGVDATLEVVADGAKNTREHAVQSEAGSEAGSGAGDTRVRGGVRVIRRGEVVARVRARRAGEDGVDVRGNAIVARVARELRVRLDASVRLLRDGRVVAMRDGALRAKEESLAIVDEFAIGTGVDFATGNVDVPGDVRVAGGVADCFVVRASRDCVVQKLVDAATLEAGRDMTLHAGAAGRGQGSLRCGRDFAGPCVSGFVVRVGRHARVEREVAECDVRVGGVFEGPACAILRGEVVATGGATIGTLGAQSGAPTTLVVGWQAELDALATRLATLRKRAAAESVGGEARMRELSMRDMLSASEAEEMTDLSFRMMQQQPVLGKLLAAFRSVQERLAVVSVPEVRVVERIEAGATIVLAGSAGGVQAVFGQGVRGPVRIVGFRERGEMESARRSHDPVLIAEGGKTSVPLASVARLSAWTRGANHEELCRLFGLELHVLLAAFAMREASKREDAKAGLRKAG